VHKIRLEQRSERSRARNVGLERARGRLILFLDDDDMLADRALEMHLRAVERYPTAIASVGGWTMFDAHGASRSLRVVRRQSLRDVWRDVLFGWVAVSGQCLFQTQSVKSVKGWDDSYVIAEDYELWLRLGRLGPIALLPDIVLLYRVHRDQWRPRNLVGVIGDIRERALAELHRTDGEDRIARAGALADIAFEHYLREEAGQALLGYIEVLKLARGPFLSPLTRAHLLKPMIACLLGKIGIRTARTLVARILGRNIEESVRVVETDGRWYGASPKAAQEPPRHDRRQP
jgi:glycosyltransferase involved in cell wall biosynthesis